MLEKWAKDIKRQISKDLQMKLMQNFNETGEISSVWHSSIITVYNA